MQMTRIAAATALALLAALPQVALADAYGNNVQVGPRPFFLVDRMDDSPLKDRLESCAAGPFRRTDFSIGHRGAPLQFPEHTAESYLAAARMGAGVLECDVTFTKDRALVCRHSQCDLHTTTDILARPGLAAKCTAPFTPADPATGRKASAKCCTSDLTLAEFKTLRGKMDAADHSATTVEEYMDGTAGWRTDLYAAGGGTVMTHAESVALFRNLGVKFTPELKAPAVSMPYEGGGGEGAFTQADYADKLVAEYRAAGVPADDVLLQSFNLDDVRHWIATAPDFGAQAVWLDGRYDEASFDPMQPGSWKPSMAELAAMGVRIVAPPMWVLVTAEDGRIVPSAYARAAKAAGLDIITWTLERSGPLGDGTKAGGGGWYYQSVKDAVRGDGDALVLLDVLAREVGVRGVFSDWPGTVTYYANCMGLK